MVCPPHFVTPPPVFLNSGFHVATALVAMVLQPCGSNNDNAANDDILSPPTVDTGHVVG